MEAIKERGRQKILIEKDLFGTVRDKVKIAQERLKAFEPSEGYYVADSGGKDSACVLALCKMAGVRFDSHYNIKRRRAKCFWKPAGFRCMIWSWANTAA